MTKNPIVLHSAQKFSEALTIFREKKFSSIPVLGPDRSVLGLLTELAFLKAAVICRSKNDNEVSVKEFQNLFLPALLMNDSDSLDSVVTTMLKKSPHRIVIIDALGKIAGIISPSDLILFITDKKEPLEVKNPVQGQPVAAVPERKAQ